jgi:hypothetical protein
MTGCTLAILGLVASALGVNVATSFNLAQRQIFAATRLQV